MLEEEKRLQGLKTTQAILRAQKESMSTLENVATYKLQIELSVTFFFFCSFLPCFSHYTNPQTYTGNEHAMPF